MAKGERWDTKLLGGGTLAEPPMGHAHHVWDQTAGELRYVYNGRPIVTVDVGRGNEPGFRHGSDGDLQSQPLVQQLYVSVDAPRSAVVTFTLSADAINMRPRRASAEQAILGQLGRPLLAGVAGLYDQQQDLQLEWGGRPWRWLDDSLSPNAAGDLTARMEVQLGAMPWYLTLRPHFYRTHLGYTYHKPWLRRPDPKAVAGWCSWEAYRHDVTQQRVEEVSRFLAEKLKPYGLEYVQIDDGFEPTPIPADPAGSIADNWLVTNEQFSNGHAGIVSAVRQHGLAPGIWASCSLSNMDLAATQPENLVRDKQGQPIEGDWVGLVLDCLPETLAKHVLPCFRGLREFGYDYLKIDQVRHLLLDGLQKAAAGGLLTNDEAERRFRAYIECVREGFGDDGYFLSSWGVLSQVIGAADACRVSMDANPTWPGMRMQIVESARWFHAQRVLFTIDPDHICVRGKLAWVRSVASLVSLSGGLFMLSDPPAAYDDDRVEILRKCLPPLRTVAGETGPLDTSYPAYTWTKLHGFAVERGKPAPAEDMSLEDAMHLAGEYPTMHDAHPLSSLWAFHLTVPGRQWCVAARLATVPLDTCELDLSNLALDPDAEYHVFDFWPRRYLGLARGTLDCLPLAFGECQILAFTPASAGPTLVASSRHVSMDAVSVCRQHWSDGILTLQLTGIPGQTETYWFARGDRTGPVEPEGKGLLIPNTEASDLVQLTVQFTAEHAELSLRFD